MKFIAAAAFCLIALTVLLGAASAETELVMEEDSSFQTDRPLHEILNTSEEAEITIGPMNENITIRIVDGFLNITSSGNWFGITLIFYGYIDGGIATDGALRLNVTPVNDAPEILGISLSGDHDNLNNPVTYSVSCIDVDGDDLKITWFLDEETAGEGETVTRYIFPDQNNLTVIIDDGNGGTDSMSAAIRTIPPEGWGDEPDNTRNRIIFWVIFGSAGLILLAAAAWVMMAPAGRRSEEPPAKDTGS
ncbi:MAG: hypothetical protein ACMUHU_04950 [Thermoplasmatota archaeon]